MHDVYVVDLDHPQDALGRTRMRLAADSIPDAEQAQHVGRAACLDMLDAAGAFDAARGHVVNAPAYPNPETVVKFALGLGDPFAGMNRFWIQNQSDGALTEYVPTAAELADELRNRDAIDPGSALADALEALAAVTRGSSLSSAPVETALRVFVGLSGADWTSAPAPFTVHGGVGIRWKHGLRRNADGALRTAGRFSVVITGSRAVFLRTTNISTAVASAETVFGSDTAAVIAECFRTGRLPGEQEESAEAAVPNPEPASQPDQLIETTPPADPEPTPEPVEEETPQEPVQTVPAEPEAPKVRLVARWNTENHQVFVTTLEGDPIEHTAMTAGDEAQAIAALDAAGFDRNGGWASVSVAPGELRVAVTRRAVAA